MSTSADRPLTMEDLRAQQAAASGVQADTSTDAGFAESTDIAIRVEANAGIVLTDNKAREQFYSYIKREVESFVPDVTTDKGRKAIASLAYSVSRSKTLIEKAKADLKREWLDKSRAVDTDWRAVERELDDLRDKARKPLTDWEAAEEARKSICKNTIDRLNAAAVVGIDATVESVHTTLADLRIINTSEDAMQEYSTMATEAKDLAIRSLSSALTRLEKEEADRAELAKLRAAHEARIRDEMQAAENEERERRAKEEAEQLRLDEEKRVADEKARIQQAADNAAREAATALQREHDAEIARLKAEQDKKDADARREREEAAAKHDAEMNRLAKQEADRKAEEVRLKKIADDKAAEDEKLAKNKAHRRELMTASKLALMQYCGIEEKHAIAVVKMIVDEKIPNITMRFTA